MQQPLKFNNVELPDFVKVTGRSISVLPPVSTQSSSVPNRIGQVFNRSILEPREYTFDIKVLLNDKELDEQADILQKWLIGNEFKPSKLMFKERPDRYINAVITGNTDLTDLFFLGEGQITFRADNPLWYKENTQTTSGTGSVTVSYSGTVTTSPVIEITLEKNCKRVEVVNSAVSNKVISLSADFKTGQKLVIDCNRRLVTLNGTVNMNLLNLSTDWFFIMPNLSNVLTVKLDSAASTASLKVTNSVIYY